MKTLKGEDNRPSHRELARKKNLYGKAPQRRKEKGLSYAKGLKNWGQWKKTPKSPTKDSLGAVGRAGLEPAKVGN